MEKYIKKINDKLLAMDDFEKAKKTKKLYRTVGYSLLGVGLAGFVASFVVFMVLFLKFQTENAFVAWIVAVPFLLMLIPGSVLARVGDVLLPETEIADAKEIRLEEIKENQDEKIEEKEVEEIKIEE